MSKTTITVAHEVCSEMVKEGSIEKLSATVMPDHVHLLFQLGERLTLDRVVAKWRTWVHRRTERVTWQANFFEHRLRIEESSEAYALYILMNPYRAGLIEIDRPWPGWWTDGDVAYEFLTRAREGPCPQPEWFVPEEGKNGGLSVGE